MPTVSGCVCVRACVSVEGVCVRANVCEFAY